MKRIQRVLVLCMICFAILSLSVTSYALNINGSVLSTNKKISESGPLGTQMEQDGSPCISIMYHKLSEVPTEIGAFCITPEDLEADIIYFINNGYQFYTASELPQLTNAQLKTAVFLTFDDGYESDLYYLLPILEKYNAKATVFVIGSMLGVGEHITKEQLAELAKSPLIEIGSHSYDIHNLSVSQEHVLFQSGNTDYIVSDFWKNALFLEEIIGKPVRSLSYPNGIWNAATDKALREAGFVATFTSEEKMIRDVNAPAGRYNRPSTIDVPTLISRAISKHEKEFGKTPNISVKDSNQTDHTKDIQNLKEQKNIQTSAIRQMFGQ